MTRTVTRGPLSAIDKAMHTYLFNREQRDSAALGMKGVYNKVSTYIEDRGKEDDKGSFWFWFATPKRVGTKTFYGLKRQASVQDTIVDEKAARKLLKRKRVSLDGATYWTFSLPEKLNTEQVNALWELASKLGLEVLPPRVETDLDDLIYRLATEGVISEDELDEVLVKGIWNKGEFVENGKKYSLCVIEEPPVVSE